MLIAVPKVGPPCDPKSGTKKSSKTRRETHQKIGKSGAQRSGKGCGQGRGGRGRGAEARGRVDEVCVGAAGARERGDGSGDHLLCTIALSRQARAAETFEVAGGG